MPKTTISVEVESSGYQLMEACAAVVKAAKSGGASAALTAAVGQVVQVVADIEALPADAKEDLAELIKGAVIGASDVVEAALGVA
jgi:hypothetical protein